MNKILAVRNDRFGEFLLTIPAFVALKQNYPGAALTLAVAPCARELAERLTCVDELILWENKKHSLNDILRFSKELKAKEYDLCVIFNPSKEFNIVSYLAGIPLRAGYNRKWGFLLNRKMEDKKSQGSSHEVDYNLELLKIVGVDSLPSGREFPLEIKNDDFPDSRLAELAIADRDLVAVHPWASNREKEWPQIKFKELIYALAKESDEKIIVIGGREEAERSVEFCKDLPVVNLTGKTTLTELAALLKRCKLLITADSGPMHLAAIEGIKVAALFRRGPASVSVKRWGPVGAGHVIFEADAPANIEIGEVLNGVKKILK